MLNGNLLRPWILRMDPNRSGSLPTTWAEDYKYQLMPHDAGQIRRSLERKFNLTFTTSGTNQSLLPTSIH